MKIFNHEVIVAAVGQVESILNTRTGEKEVLEAQVAAVQALYNDCVTNHGAGHPDCIAIAIWLAMLVLQLEELCQSISSLQVLLEQDKLLGILPDPIQPAEPPRPADSESKTASELLEGQPLDEADTEIVQPGEEVLPDPGGLVATINGAAVAFTVEGCSTVEKVGENQFKFEVPAGNRAVIRFDIDQKFGFQVVKFENTALKGVESPFPANSMIGSDEKAFAEWRSPEGEETSFTIQF